MLVPIGEWTRSVEIVWVAWLAGLLGLCWLIRRGLKRLEGGTLRSLLFSERGAAYSMSYVMVFPIFLLLVCLVIEASLILVVKIGTVYAAYAAARSAVVWKSANPGIADSRIRLAAVHAMVPFADSTQGGGGGGDAGAFVQAYQSYSGGWASSGYLTSKYQHAQGATQVQATDPSGPDDDIRVSVTFDMPLHVPGIARFLATHGRIRRIVSTATLPNEGARNSSQRLGINYVPQ